jgi:transcriptional regulator with XRE-family HTH domain
VIENKMNIQLNLPIIRAKLGMSQRELALYLGVSIRAIQSSEQGWRTLSPALERLLLLLLLTKRHGDQLHQLTCWTSRQCSPDRCAECIIYSSRQGYLCWLLTGNRCHEHTMQHYHEKLAHCTQCAFFQQLFSLDTFIHSTEHDMPSNNS